MGSCVAAHFCIATHFKAWAGGALSLACAGRCLLCGQRTDTGDTQMGDAESPVDSKANRLLTLPAGGIHRQELAPVSCAQWKVMRRLRGEGARVSADQRFAVGNSDTVVFDPSSAVVMAVPIDLAKQA